MTTLPPRKPLRATSLRDIDIDPEKPLTTKQRRFVDEYLLDMNATAAAKRAGYREHSAAQNGSGFLQRPNVAAEVERRLAERRQRTDVTAQRVIRELARIAFADIGRIMTWSGDDMTVRPPGEISEDDRAAIAEVAAVKRKNGDVAARVVLHDKERALEALCRFLGLFNPRAAYEAGVIKSPAQLADEVRGKLLARLEQLRAAQAEEAEDAEG